MLPHNYSCCRITTRDEFGWEMMNLDERWWIWMRDDELWWIMMNYNELWWNYDELWWIMMNYNEIQWKFMIFGRNRATAWKNDVRKNICLSTRKVVYMNQRPLIRWNTAPRQNPSDFCSGWTFRTFRTNTSENHFSQSCSGSFLEHPGSFRASKKHDLYKF